MYVGAYTKLNEWSDAIVLAMWIQNNHCVGQGLWKLEFRGFSFIILLHTALVCSYVDTQLKIR